MIHNKPTPEQTDICHKLGDFYVHKHHYDYKAGSAALQNLHITDIQVKEDKISIYLARPGLLIGRKGQNLQELQIFLNKPIEIIESFHWNDMLLPIDPNHL